MRFRLRFSPRLKRVLSLCLALRAALPEGVQVGVGGQIEQGILRCPGLTAGIESGEVPTRLDRNLLALTLGNLPTGGPLQARHRFIKGVLGDFLRHALAQTMRVLVPRQVQLRVQRKHTHVTRCPITHSPHRHFPKQRHQRALTALATVHP